MIPDDIRGPNGRPEFYAVGLKDGDEPWMLCRCCAAVLICEGHVAGDPTSDGLMAEDVERMGPSSVAHCDTCEAIRRFEEKRALLSYPPARIGGGIIITGEARVALEEAE